MDLALIFLAALLGKPDVAIDAGFPGGNIIFDRIEGSQVFLRPDLRDTEGEWFYWYFRIRGAEGRTLTFRFTRGNPIGVRGPAASQDGGATWAWLGGSAVKGPAFQYAFGARKGDVRFAFAVPYVQKNLRNFIAKYESSPHLKLKTLSRTRKGRTAERISLGRLDGKCRFRVLITCRHHACESMASFTLEGILEEVLSGTEDGRWLRDQVEFLLIPFMDKDGVEDGDQGKNRKPHDHNRDYAGESRYPTVQALRNLVPEWSGGKLRIAFDLHCPWIRGDRNETVYFVGGPRKTIWNEVGRFSRILESVQRGPIPFRSKNNLPFGQGWNTEKNYAAGKSFSR